MTAVRVASVISRDCGMNPAWRTLSEKSKNRGLDNVCVSAAENKERG